MLHEVAEFENVLLALGGGTPCFYDNMDYLNQCGTTIFLNASPNTIIQHLKISHTVRPLLKDKQGKELYDHIQNQLNERLPFYSKAKYTINVDILDSFDKIDLLIEKIIEEIEKEDIEKIWGR